MVLATDLKRRQITLLNRIRGAMTPVDCSAGMYVVDGSDGQVEPVEHELPSDYRSFGGLFIPATYGMRVVDKPLMRWSLLPYQLAPLTSEAQIIFVSGGMRSGKSRTAMMWAIRHALNTPNLSVAVLLPSYKKWSGYDKTIYDLAAPFIQSFAAKDYRYTFFNGSTLTFFSDTAGSNEQTGYLGLHIDKFIVSELREFKDRRARDHIFKAYSRLGASSDGQLLIETSPELGHVTEELAGGLLSPVEAGETGVEVDVHILDARDNPYLSQRYLNTARALYPRDVYERDVLGRFAQRRDVDYHCYDASTHMVKNPTGTDITTKMASTNYYLRRVLPSLNVSGTLKQARPFCWVVAMDQAGEHTHALLIRLYLDGGDVDELSLKYHVAKEIQYEKRGIVPFLKHIHSLPELKNVAPNDLLVLPDVRYLAFTKTGDGKDIIQILTQQKYQKLFRKNVSREAAISAVNTKFQLGHISIDPACIGLRKSLLNFKSVSDQRKNSRSQWGHYCDCLKIAVSTLTPWQWLRKHATQHLPDAQD